MYIYTYTYLCINSLWHLLRGMRACAACEHARSHVHAHTRCGRMLTCTLARILTCTLAHMLAHTRSHTRSHACTVIYTYIYFVYVPGALAIHEPESSERQSLSSRSKGPTCMHGCTQRGRVSGPAAKPGTNSADFVCKALLHWPPANPGTDSAPSYHSPLCLPCFSMHTCHLCLLWSASIAHGAEVDGSQGCGLVASS